MKQILPTISTAALCLVCGTAANAGFFALMALVCRFIDTNSSATWGQAAQSGSMLGLAAGTIISGILAWNACWSVDVSAMRKKFVSRYLLALLAGAVVAATIGTYVQFNGSHGETLLEALARRQGIGTQTALAYLTFGTFATGVMAAAALCLLFPLIVPRAAVTAIHDLIFPINATKYLVVCAGGIGTVWGMLLPSAGLLQATYKLVFGSLMWGVATLYLCDFAAALTGRSSPYWEKFYAEIKNDLFVCGVSGLTMILLVTRSYQQYSWYSLDLALLGLPFFLNAIVAIHECATIKVGGRTFPRRVRITLCTMLASLYAVITLILFDVQSKTMPEHEALWYQISIFFAGVSALIFARQIPYMLKQGRIEPSPVFLRMFSGMKSSLGIYAQVALAAQHWNQQVKVEKAMHRREKARASKGKRR